MLGQRQPLSSLSTNITFRSPTPVASQMDMEPNFAGNCDNADDFDDENFDFDGNNDGTTADNEWTTATTTPASGSPAPSIPTSVMLSGLKRAREFSSADESSRSTPGVKRVRPNRWETKLKELTTEIHGNAAASRDFESTMLEKTDEQLRIARDTLRVQQENMQIYRESQARAHAFQQKYLEIMSSFALSASSSSQSQS